MMRDVGSSIGAVARSTTPPLHGAGLSGVGALGIGLEFKHAIEAFTHAFKDCTNLYDVFRCVMAMDTTTFLGLGVWVLITGASILMIISGLISLARSVIGRLQGPVRAEHSEEDQGP